MSLSVALLSDRPLVAAPLVWGERGGERRKGPSEIWREKRRGGGGGGKSERRASMAIIVLVLPFKGL